MDSINRASHIDYWHVYDSSIIIIDRCFSIDIRMIFHISCLLYIYLDSMGKLGLHGNDLTKLSVLDQNNPATPCEVLNTIISVLGEYKASDIKAFQCNDDYFTDFVVIATCTSDRHISGIAEKLSQALKRKCSIFPLQSPNSGGWILVDAKNVMVHLMSDSKRILYDIETLMLSIGNEQIESLFDRE